MFFRFRFHAFIFRKCCNIFHLSNKYSSDKNTIYLFPLVRKIVFSRKVLFVLLCIFYKKDQIYLIKILQLLAFHSFQFTSINRIFHATSFLFHRPIKVKIYFQDGVYRNLKLGTKFNLPTYTFRFYQLI